MVWSKGGEEYFSILASELYRNLKHLLIISKCFFVVVYNIKEDASPTFMRSAMMSVSAIVSHDSMAFSKH